MKVRRTLSGLLFGMGCAITFVGFLALILPGVENEQLKLVLASFETPSNNMLVNAINSAMTFALRNHWQVVTVGVIAMLVGGILLSHLGDKPSRVHDNYRRPPAPIPDEEPAFPANEPVPVINPFAVACHTFFEPEASKKAPENDEDWLEKYRRFEPVSLLDQYDVPAARAAVSPEPLLDKNPIEQPPAAAEVPYVRPLPPQEKPLSSAVQPCSDETSITAAETGVRSLSGARPIMRPPVERSEPAPVAVSLSAAPEVADPAPQPVPSRIRSTMGKHRR